MPNILIKEITTNNINKTKKHVVLLYIIEFNDYQIKNIYNL